jgi:hypothetical protein
MAKRFNGSKMSHGHRNVPRLRCPRCDNLMQVFLGQLRCTQMVSTPGGDRRVIKHGSMQTIQKRMSQEAAAA